MSARAGHLRDHSGMSGREMEALLAEQVAYYSAVAPEYEDHALRYVGRSGEELVAALDDFRPEGDVLELACGPGTWTRHLVDHASHLTCVDASPEMLDIAESHFGAAGVRFERADIFTWRPSQRFDVVFFGFWLSHVPPERFEQFWSFVADCLKPEGRVFFVDDGYRTPDELIEGESSATIQRRLNDGSAHRLVKIPLRPAELEQRLRGLGWSIPVRPTALPGPFLWGAGARA
jgi:SAM-dependent methyltransferase